MKNKIRKIIQYTYLIIFFITSFGIIGNDEMNTPTPRIWIILFVVSGILTVGKLAYCKINYPNKAYYWDFD